MHTYIFIKIHKIGNHFDIRMVDSSLMDNFLKNVPNPGRKYEHGDIMFTELIKEVLIPFSAKKDVNISQISKKKSQERSQFAENITSYLENSIVFTENLSSFPLPHLFRLARTINLTQSMQS